jgi:excisionase family DNA binding protein
MPTIEKPPAVDRLVGINTAADTLGYSVSGIRKLIETGVLPVVRLRPNGRFRFRVSDLERLVADNKEET